MKSKFGSLKFDRNMPVSYNVCSAFNWLAVISFAVMIFLVVTVFKFQDNSIKFEKQVEAKVIKVSVNEHYQTRKRKNAAGYSKTNTSYTYDVKFSVDDNGSNYEVFQFVSKDIYKEYEKLYRSGEKYTFYMYVNNDNKKYLTLNGDEQQANEEYKQSGSITKNMAYYLLGAMGSMAAGFIFLTISASVHKKIR